MNQFRKHHVGGAEYIYGLRLEGQFYLIVGVEGVQDPEHDDRIGRVQHWSYGQIKDSVEVSLDKVKFHEHFEQMFSFIHQKELRADEKCTKEIYTEDKSGVRKLLKYVFKTDRYYETGGYLCIQCTPKQEKDFTQFLKAEGFKVGTTLANMK